MSHFMHAVLGGVKTAAGSLDEKTGEPAWGDSRRPVYCVVN